MTDKRKEALEAIDRDIRICKNPLAPVHIEREHIQTIKQALQQPDYKAMCEKMATSLNELQSVFVAKTSEHVEKYHKANIVLKEYQAMKGGE